MPPVALPLPLPPAFPGPLPPPAAAAAPVAGRLPELCDAVQQCRAARRVLERATGLLMDLVYTSGVHGQYAAAPIRLYVRGALAGSAGFALMHTAAATKPTAKEVRQAFRSAFSTSGYGAAHLEARVRGHLQATCDAILNSGHAPPGAWVRLSRRTTSAAARRADAGQREEEEEDDDQDAGAEDDRDAAPVSGPVVTAVIRQAQALSSTLPRGSAAGRACRSALNGAINALRVARSANFHGCRGLSQAGWEAHIAGNRAAWRAGPRPRFADVAPHGRGMPLRLLWALLIAYDAKRMLDRTYARSHAALCQELVLRHGSTARTTVRRVRVGPHDFIVSLVCPLPMAAYQLELVRAHNAPEYTALLARAAARARAAGPVRPAPFLSFVSD